MISNIVIVNNTGYVELISTSNLEKDISKFAGISYESEKGPPVTKLIDLDHMSPFEFASVTFKIKAPIFVARQWMRHRTGHYMEKSLRYCKADFDFYVPTDIEKKEADILKNIYSESVIAYQNLINNGMPKERARMVLPTALYTTFYFNIDLRNFIHFIKLRLDKHAQKEIRDYSKAMVDLLGSTYPKIMKVLRK